MLTTEKHKIAFKDLGLIDYKEAWDLQEETLRKVVDLKLRSGERTEPDGAAAGQIVYFCQHPHVYTLGKSGKHANLLIPDQFLQKINASFYRIDRGGDITYHGPGQIVGYPIIDLEYFGIKVREYVWKLEESLICTLAVYGVRAARMEGATGVWLDTGEPAKARKIAAIGVRVSRYVTMHGFAFNVNTDLKYFQYINPCGFQDKGVTSLQQETGKELDMNEVSRELKTQLSAVFHFKLTGD